MEIEEGCLHEAWHAYLLLAGFTGSGDVVEVGGTALVPTLPLHSSGTNTSKWVHLRI